MSYVEIFNLQNKELDNLILCRGKDKISTELEGETVILNLTSGNYSGLDEVGSSIWKLLEQPRSFQDICRDILAEFEVEEDVCRKDLLSFIKDLADNKLITVQNGKTV